jgi:hypothetical protein
MNQPAKRTSKNPLKRSMNDAKEKNAVKKATPTSAYVAAKQSTDTDAQFESVESVKSESIEGKKEASVSIGPKKKSKLEKSDKSDKKSVKNKNLLSFDDF